MSTQLSWKTPNCIGTTFFLLEALAMSCFLAKRLGGIHLASSVRREEVLKMDWAGKMHNRKRRRFGCNIFMLFFPAVSGKLLLCVYATVHVNMSLSTSLIPGLKILVRATKINFITSLASFIFN